MPACLPRILLWVSYLRARHVLILCSLAIGVMLAAGVTALLLAARQDAVAGAARDLRRLALLLSEDVDRDFRTAALVQADLIRSMQRDGIESPAQFSSAMASPAVREELRRRITGLPHIGALGLIDAEGRVVNHSRSAVELDVDARDWAFVEQLRRHPADTVISAPIRVRLAPKSSAIESWSILFARGFTASDGRLLGIVVAVMDLAPFERFFARVSGGGDAAVALFRRDGVLLAQHPTTQRDSTEVSEPRPAFSDLLVALDHGTVPRAGVLDDRQRLIAPVGVPHFPLVVVVSNTMASVLADWRREALGFSAVALLTELVLAGVVVLGVRRAGDQDRLNAAYARALETEADRTLAQAEQDLAWDREQRERLAHLQTIRFDTALRNMVQGLLMVNRTGELQVVNRRFCELAAVPAASLQPGMAYAELVEQVLAGGAISRQDMAVLQDWRTNIVDRRERASFTWDLADGRTFRVTHQPMEDGWLTTYEDVTERRNAHAAIVRMAHYDALTDLPNRALFRERLQQSLALARRGRKLALLCLDLDQFKAINDTLGHPVGDGLLRAVAQRLTQRIRETDTIARLGGDEFAIIQVAIERPTEATDFAARLIEILQEPFDIAGHRIIIGASIGIAFAPQDGTDPDVLLKNAEMQARRVLELDLRQALPAGQFELFYQPLVDLRARAVTGFEALLRWRHPQNGLVPPDRFIPLAEEIGAIVPIGEWVMREACATAAGWPGSMKVAVNLSPVQFKSRNLVKAVAAALRELGLPPARLELEITETVMLQDTDTTLATLHELHALGVHIAMDDFGTGYSSLSYLRRFPFDRIKIDKSFIRELGERRDCGAIVRAVIELSRELGMATTAEGVETQDQLHRLALAGCTDIQGFLFSPPVPRAAVAELLQTLEGLEHRLAGLPVSRAEVHVAMV